jgi:mono/diheme cytochrome c family protein
MMTVLQICGFTAAGFALSLSTASAKMTPEQIARLPSPAAKKVEFSSDIKPILESACVKCHGRGKAKGGFRLDTRRTFLEAADSGPAVLVGKSAESYLIELVAGVDPDNVMPRKGSKLKPEQIALLRAWIDQDLLWDEGISFGKAAALNLQPRQPALPADSQKLTHPVDRFLDVYFAEHKIQPAKPVDDRTYARRVYLDIVGLLPAPEELAAFLKDKRKDKRDRLVDRLLGSNRLYAEHWLSFWNDLLRNDYRGTGYIDGGRKQISSWLFSALATNMRYDQFVAELVNPKPESEGFVKGIVWRGTVNASQTPQMQAAQNISQVFMGVNLKCASCHDSFINDWSLADAYGMASVYSTNTLEMFECDKPTRKKATPKFLYPELGDIPASASTA